MTKTPQPESKAVTALERAAKREGIATATLERARGELLAAASELKAIKARLLTTGRRLRKAVATAEVVGTEFDGTDITLEGWIGDYIADAKGGLTAGLDELIDDVARQADFPGQRTAIGRWVECDREVAARQG